MKIRGGPVPLLPWLLSALGAIVSCRVFQISPSSLWLLLGFIMLLVGLITKRKIFIFPLVFFFFIFRASSVFNPQANDLSKYLPFEGKVYGKISLSQKNPILKVSAIELDGETLPAKGCVALNFPLENPPPYSYLKLSGKFSEPSGAYYPGSYNMKEKLKLEGVFTYAEPEEVSIISEGLSFIPRMRKYFRKLARTYLSGEGAPFLEGMLLGDESALTDESIENFRKAGIMHILAVSGLHSGLVFFAVFFLLSSLRTPKKMAVIFSLCFMYFYVLVSGSRPPAVRAALMLTALAVGELCGGRGNLFNTLFMAALVMLGFSPGLIYSPGFLLSFLAVFGIAYLSPVFSPYLGAGIGVSLAASMGIFPIVAWNFYFIPLLSPLTNLFVVPLASFGVSAGLLMLISAPLLPWMASLYGSAAELAMWLIALISRLVSHLPFAGFYCPRPHPMTVVGFYIVLISIGIKNKKKLFLILLGLVFVLLGYLPKKDFVADFEVANLRSVFLSSKGETVLFTDGGGAGYEILEKFLYSKGVRRVKEIYFLLPPSRNLRELESFCSRFKVKSLTYLSNIDNEYGWELFKEKFGKDKFRAVQAPLETIYKSFIVKIISDGDLIRSRMELVIEGENKLLITPDLPDKSGNFYQDIIVYTEPPVEGGYFRHFEKLN